MASLALTYTATALVSAPRLGLTYSAASLPTTIGSLSLGYSVSGTAQVEALKSSRVKIYTPPAAYLKNFHPVVQRWFRDVSKLLNDGIEGQEVITPVLNTATQLDTAVTEAKAAAQVADAAAASASESVQNVERVVVVVNQEVDDVRNELIAQEARIAALET